MTGIGGEVSVYAFKCVTIHVGKQNDALVVNGDGATKEEATHAALRSAIEQAFGTFVSANTTILNDELVKDEIATVSSGNIQSFTELSSYTLPNGNMSVSLQVTVSIGKLVTYAKSKGVIMVLLSNITLLSQKHIDLFKEYPVELISTTMYGYSEETYERVTGVKGSYSKFMNALDLIQKPHAI